MNPSESNPAPEPSPTVSAGTFDILNRRKFIGLGSSALLMAALTVPRAQAQNIEAVTAAQKGASANNPGPENGPLRDINPNSDLPPATDHGEAPEFWNSFMTAKRRIQDGGWTRQVTVESFPISKDIAGVNMRLLPGAYRELHWHAAAEWAIMLAGKARITALDNDGKGYVKDVAKDDLWFFPPGIPHSIQGLESDANGCEFLLVFDDGAFSEGNTTLLTDWARHTPPEVLAKNWGVSEAALENVYKVPAEGLFIFQRAVPGPLEDDQHAISTGKGRSPVAFDFPLHSMAPTHENKSGQVRIIDSKNFPVTTMAAAHVVVKPGAMRELHWHQTANEWQYYIQGKGRMTVFFTGGLARTMDFAAGDIGYIPRAFGHYVENTGDTDLIFLEVFKEPHYKDLALSEWLTHLPPQIVIDHLGISAETLKAIPSTEVIVMPT